MTMSSDDDARADFSTPPLTFVDDADRTIEIRQYTGDDAALIEMYEAFDPADRAQGIPPTESSRVKIWLDSILETGIDVVAWHGEDAIGHATLVADPETDAHELAIFVLSEYQGSGVGTKLVEALLGAGKAAGVGHVWLSVERWNTPAVAIYRKVGFERTGDESLEIKMERDLD